MCPIFFFIFVLPNYDKKFGIRAIYKNFGIIVFNVMFYSNIGIELIFSRKEPMGGQRGTLGRVKLRIIALKSRAMSQYGGGMGGVLQIRKEFGKPPCKFVYSLL